MARMYNFSTSDTVLGEWRRNQEKQASNHVQKQIKSLQYPTKCNDRDIVQCDLYKCGFGCEMHHLVFCQLTAYFKKRLFVLKSKGWAYNPAGYQEYFHELTNCSNIDTDKDFLKLGRLCDVQKKPDYILPSIDAHIGNTVARFTDDPMAWFTGQFLLHLFKFNKDFQQIADEYEKSIFNRNPKIGIHVRRTDKLKGDSFFIPIDDYMKHVDYYFELLEYMKPAEIQEKRVVYLVTDDKSILGVIQKKFPKYVFLYNDVSTKLALKKDRFKPDSIENFILDIYILSKLEFFIGTASSNIGRLVYELMQTTHPDGSWRFRSLDNAYFYRCQRPDLKKVLFDHFPSDNFKNLFPEMDIRKGDTIESIPKSGRSLFNNMFNGYSFGQNLRTGEFGAFPTYKVKPIIQVF